MGLSWTVKESGYPACTSSLARSPTLIIPPPDSSHRLVCTHNPSCVTDDSLTLASASLGSSAWNSLALMGHVACSLTYLVLLICGLALYTVESPNGLLFLDLAFFIAVLTSSVLYNLLFIWGLLLLLFARVKVPVRQRLWTVSVASLPLSAYSSD